MSTIFTKIIQGEIPCYKVAETDDFIAFLDINPNTIGHTLCVPKIEVDDILELDENSYNKLMLFSRKVAMSIKNVINCKKVSISVIGLEVPHVHVHLIPINKMNDANFSVKISQKDKDFISTARQISNAFTNF